MKKIHWRSLAFILSTQYILSFYYLIVWEIYLKNLPGKFEVWKKSVYLVNFSVPLRMFPLFKILENMISQTVSSQVLEGNHTPVTSSYEADKYSFPVLDVIHCLLWKSHRDQWRHLIIKVLADLFWNWFVFCFYWGRNGDS